MAASRLYCADTLEKLVREIFQALGALPAPASESARHLLRSNLSGHDSHGVIRMAQYVAQTEAGEIAPSAMPVVARETGATALIDARRSLGLYSTMFALDWAIARARRHGIAAAVRHSTHIGRLGEYTEKAAAEGLVSIVTVGAAGPGVGGMVIFGGRKRFYGANPWSMGVPAVDGALPMVFDGSTSTIAEGKVRVARAKKAQLPPDCIIDPDGAPTTDPEQFYAGGALVPLGGRVAGHKGYGLAMASALIGALAMIDDPDPTLIGAQIREQSPDPRGRVAGVFVIVIDPAAFGDASSYRAMAAEHMAAAKRVPAAEGVAEVLTPGEIEHRTRLERRRDGIPLPEATWRDLEQLAARFKLVMPEPGN
jgi:LDH2 family malate/lactate/ureidoglycolate dehydrogenase